MSPAGHMDPATFRAEGRRVVDWVADYWSRVADYPVLSPVPPGAVAAALPVAPPEEGEPDLASVLADLDRVVLPGITHWQSPHFYAYFPANASGPSVLGDLLSSGLGVQGMLWATSPACTEVEQVMLDWLVALFGLPSAYTNAGGVGGGVLQDSSSGAGFVALQAALHHATDGAFVTAGVPSGGTVYVSSETHSSIEKAARMAGLGSDAVRSVAVDPRTLAMRPDALRAALAADTAAGLRPVMVAATIGTTSTTAIDPVAELGPICREYGVWLHVDAAYAGVAAVSPRLRWINDGVAEYADSYCTDLHKWLLTNFDATALWVRDRRHLVGALAILPEYLRNPASTSGAVVDYRDWQVELGRRFRALKVWLVLRWYGAAGLRAHVEGDVELAATLAGWVRESPDVDLVVDHPLSLVCLRPRWPGLDDAAADAATMAVIGRINASGAAYLTHTRVAGRAVIRVAIGAPTTTLEHVRALWDLLQREIALS